MHIHLSGRSAVAGRFAYGGKVFATGNAGDVFAGKCEEGGDASAYAASTGDEVFQRMGCHNCSVYG